MTIKWVRPNLSLRNFSVKSCSVNAKWWRFFTLWTCKNSVPFESNREINSQCDLLVKNFTGVFLNNRGNKISQKLREIILFSSTYVRTPKYSNSWQQIAWSLQPFKKSCLFFNLGFWLSKRPHHRVAQCENSRNLQPKRFYVKSISITFYSPKLVFHQGLKCEFSKTYELISRKI